MKLSLYEQICSQLTLERSSADRIISLYSNIDPQVIIAIYLRRSQNMYKVAHANLTAVNNPPEYFYNEFKALIQQKIQQGADPTFVMKEMGEKVGLPSCLMARFILKSFIFQYPDFISAINVNNNNHNAPAPDSIENDLEVENSRLTTDNSNLNNNSNISTDTLNPITASNYNSNNTMAMKTAAANISKILKNPECLKSLDPFLFLNINFCLENDFLTSPAMDVYRHRVGLEKEELMQISLKSMNILFHSEAAMRAAGYPKTPDALLAYPVEVNGHIVNWVESKALFGDFSAHNMYLKDQYWPYYNRFGPGLVIYWFGFIDEINNEKEKGILVMDRFPDKMTKISLYCTWPFLWRTIAPVRVNCNYKMIDDAEDEIISFSSKIIESNSNDLHPVAEILDNLKNDDLALRLGALKRLTTIALALGPDRTTNDLIPFLASLAADEEDEVLLVLAEELPKLVEYLVDGGKSAHKLLEVLEILLQAEETVVKQQAVTATQQVMESLTDSLQIEKFLWPMWLRLAQGTFFISKSSAATLAALIYEKLAGNMKLQGELRAVFASAICSDDCPIPRRAAAPILSKLVILAAAEDNGSTIVANELWPLFMALSADAQDSVRLLAVDAALSFGKVLPPQSIHDLLLPVVLKLTGDRSWRVRYLVGASFTGLIEHVFIPSGSVSVDALSIFTALLSDAEAEVRTAASRQLAGTCAQFSKAEFERKILPVLRCLASDSAVSVRAAVATQLNPLSAIAGAESASTSLFPLYTHFFADESSQVRLNAVSKMDVVCQVMGIEKLSESILPAILHLSSDKQWRVREAVIEHLPTLTCHLGEKFFDENLVKICLDLLNDPVFAVRKSATQNLKALIEKFGIDWCRGRLLQPALTQLTTSSSYLRRTGVGRVVQVLIPIGDEQFFLNLALPALKALSTDSIPNVRISVARAFYDILPVLKTRGYLHGNETAQIGALLQMMKNDADADVQYFAHRADELLIAAN